MRSELENSAQIDRYLNQQMAGEELGEFLQKLEDPAFRSEVEEHRLLRELVVDRGLIDLRKKLLALDGNEPRHVNRFIKWGVGILLVMIVGGLTTYHFTGDDAKLTVPPAERNDTDTLGKPVAPTAEATIAASDNKKGKPVSDSPVQRDTTRTEIPSITSPSKPNKEAVGDSEAKSAASLATADTLAAKKPAEPEKKSEKKIPDCAIAASELKIIALASCVNSPTGQIVIDGQSKLKGTAPFQFSINGGRYSVSRSFIHLYSGNYILTVRDSAGCEWRYPDEISVDEKDCEVTAYAFYPGLGEVWKLPVTSMTNGRIEIYNKNGSRVYTAEIVNGYPDQWDGTSSDGHALPMGSYSFILSVGGKSTSGSVTILR